MSALHLAASTGNAETVIELLAHGYDASSRSNVRHTRGSHTFRRCLRGMGGVLPLSPHNAKCSPHQHWCLTVLQTGDTALTYAEQAGFPVCVAVLRAVDGSDGSAA